MLKQALLAINSPRHRHHSGTPKGLGHAFCEYVTRYPTDRLPQTGGVDATIVVTMTLENLLGDSHTPATLDTGDRITADQARKLPVRPGSSRWSSAGSPRSSTSAARSGSTTGPSESRSDTATGTAPATAATGPQRCATSTTTHPGAGAGRPTSPTDVSYALATTPTPTHRSTR